MKFYEHDFRLICVDGDAAAAWLPERKAWQPISTSAGRVAQLDGIELSALDARGEFPEADFDNLPNLTAANEAAARQYDPAWAEAQLKTITEQG